MLKSAKTSCHFIAIKKTTKNNLIFETNFETPVTKVFEYDQEIYKTLNEQYVLFVDIKPNSVWLKFILYDHDLLNTIGDGLKVAQLVASEIRSNYVSWCYVNTPNNKGV